MQESGRAERCHRERGWNRRSNAKGRCVRRQRYIGQSKRYGDDESLCGVRGVDCFGVVIEKRLSAQPAQPTQPNLRQARRSGRSGHLHSHSAPSPARLPTRSLGADLLALALWPGCYPNCTTLPLL